MQKIEKKSKKAVDIFINLHLGIQPYGFRPELHGGRAGGDLGGLRPVAGGGRRAGGGTKTVITGGNGLSLSDKERMDVVDQVYTKMLEYRNLTRYYTRKTIS